MTLVRIIKRGVLRNALQSPVDTEVTRFNGKPPTTMTRARDYVKEHSKKDKSYYFGHEIWHEGCQSWVNRTFYYNGYEISARGSL